MSVKILNHLGLKKPMVSYYRHNMETSGPAIVQRLLDGRAVRWSLTPAPPAISDPGEQLVQLCVVAGVPVVALPGLCPDYGSGGVRGCPLGDLPLRGFWP